MKCTDCQHCNLTFCTLKDEKLPIYPQNQICEQFKKKEMENSVPDNFPRKEDCWK